MKKCLIFFSLQNIKLNTKNINFDDKKIKKSNFYKNKKALVSKKQPYATKNALKYFSGYNDNDAIRPLCLRLLQMTGYFEKFNENATRSFRVNNKQLLKKYNKIWEKTEKLKKDKF